MPTGFKTIGSETVHACLIRLIGISGSRSSSQSWIHCGLKSNNNNNNKELYRGKRRKKPAQPCYNTRRVIYILFIFFTPLCTPSEVDRVKNFVVFSTVRAAKVIPFLSLSLSSSRHRPLFIFKQRTHKWFIPGLWVPNCTSSNCVCVCVCAHEFTENDIFNAARVCVCVRRAVIVYNIIIAFHTIIIIINNIM